MKLASSSGAKGTKGAQAPLHTDERRHFDFGASGGKGTGKPASGKQWSRKGSISNKVLRFIQDFQELLRAKICTRCPNKFWTGI